LSCSEPDREQSLLSKFVSSMGQATPTPFGELLRENLPEKLKKE
jgi:hypothetical protein